MRKIESQDDFYQIISRIMIHKPLNNKMSLIPSKETLIRLFHLEY